MVLPGQLPPQNLFRTRSHSNGCPGRLTNSNTMRACLLVPSRANENHRSFPPRAKELHPRFLPTPPPPKKPFWRRRSSENARKKSNTPTVDSGVAGLSTSSSPVHRVTPPENEGIADINAIADTSNTGAERLPRYTGAHSSQQVTVSYRDVTEFWSGNAYISDDEDSPNPAYKDPVIRETLGERLRDRFQDFRERNNFFVKREKKRGKDLLL